MKAEEPFQVGLIVTRLERIESRNIVTAEAAGALLTLPVRHATPLPKLGSVIYLRWDTE